MSLPKHILIPLVDEFNSKPCPYCGKNHRVVLSENPNVYLEIVDGGCARWNTDLNDRARAILSDFFSPRDLR